MPTLFIQQFQCEHCSTTSSDSNSWALWSLQDNAKCQSIDFCPTCIASLGQKALMKEWVDASDSIPGLS